MEIEYRARYYVYVVADREYIHLEVGATVDLKSRLAELVLSRTGETVNLLYYEQFDGLEECLQRESDLNNLSKRRLWKIVVARNPGRVSLQL